MKSIRIIFNFLILLLSLNLYAGSVLSSKGAGNPFLYPNTRAMGMGGLFIANPNPYTISRINPAGLSSITNTRLSLQYFYENNKYKDHKSQSATSQYSNLDGFNFVLPIGKKVGFGLGLQPLTRMDYRLSWNGETQGIDYQKSIEGTGGLNIISLSFHWSPFSWISLGISGHYMFGEMEETWKVAYYEENFLPTKDIFSTKNWGFNYTAGLIINPFKKLTLGAVYSPNINLKNETNIYYSFLTDTSLSHEGSLTFPGYWGFGGTYQLQKHILVGLEYLQKDWSVLTINDQPVEDSHKINRLSVGGEFTFSQNESDPYWKKIFYRLGFSTQPHFTLDPDGNTIKENWFTLGFGLPLWGRKTQIDVALNFGKRGSLETNGLTENLFRLSLSLTGGEQWFIRNY